MTATAKAVLVYDWRKADTYARNRVLRRLMIEADHVDKHGDGVTVDEYAYRAAIVLLSLAAK